jgi:hypothetical protein
MVFVGTLLASVALHLTLVVALHEAMHALVAWAVGARVVRVKVFGGTWWAGSWAGVPVEVGRPWHGLHGSVELGEETRWAPRLLVSLAGPATHLVLLVVWLGLAWAWVDVSVLPGERVSVVFSAPSAVFLLLAGQDAMLALLNTLSPGSDGDKAFAQLRGREPWTVAFARSLRVHFADFGQRGRPLRGDWARLERWRATLDASDDRTQTMAPAVVGLIAEEDVTPAERAGMWVFLARWALLRDDAEAWSEAARDWLDRAETEAPAPLVDRVRAQWDAVVGDPEAALAGLDPVAEGPVEVAMWALAHRRAGDVAAAEAREAELAMRADESGHDSAVALLARHQGSPDAGHAPEGA